MSADIPADRQRDDTAHHDNASGGNRNPRNAATGASAASIRAVSSQLIAFYFRAPIKAFFRTRFDYTAYARATNPNFQSQQGFTWRMTTPFLLVDAIRQHGWSFLPNQVLPPMFANITIGAILYTSYLQTLGVLYDRSAQSSKRVYPPPPVTSTFQAGFVAGCISSLAAAPLDALQVRFTTSDMLEGKYKSMWQYAGAKLREIGLRGVFAGYSISLVKDSLGYACFFATFETIKSQMYYAYVRRYYGNLKPFIWKLEAEPGEISSGKNTPRPAIRPHYALEPAFLLAAGITASVAQQTIQHPLAIIQACHYGRLESIDYATKREQPRARGMMSLYYKAYQRTWQQCKQQASLVGWRGWLYKDFAWTTIRQVPSTSAGLIVFELVRRKYATDADAVRIQKDGYDILLT